MSVKRRGIAVAVFAASLGLSTQSAGASGRSAQCPDPSILIGHSPSPAVTLVCTGNGFPIRTAATIGQLSDVRPHSAFAAGGRPAWASGGYWAPDLEKVGNRYLLYYSALRRGDRRHCIGVAISRRPSGGFRDIGAPLIDTEPDGAIDPALLSVDGQLFLLYKRDGNSVGAPSVIFGRRLSADGIRLAGSGVVLLRSRRGGWEDGIVEGPAPVHLGHTTYLLYSEGRFYAAAYAEGEAVRTGYPLGRYRRAAAAPILHGRGGWVGTAGASVVADDGRLLLAYAGFRRGEKTLRRMLFIRELGLVDGILRPTGPARQIRLRGG